MQTPLSLRAFLSWVEKQPADKEYQWSSFCGCAVDQYAATLGISFGDIYVDEVCKTETGFWRVADDIACEMPRTFGALASRLREQVQ